MKSIRLTATPIESNSRIKMPSGFSDDTVHVMVVGAPNAGKTIVLAMILEKLRELGIADSNIEIDSVDLENAEISYSEKLQNSYVLDRLKAQRYVLHEVQAYRPMSIGSFDEFVVGDDLQTTIVNSTPLGNVKRRLIDSGVPAGRIEMAEEFFTISTELKTLGILGRPSEDQYALFILGDIVSFGVLYNEASRLRMSAHILAGKSIEVEDAASAAERICVEDATAIWDAIKNQKPLPSILYTKSGSWLVNQMSNRV